MNPKRWATVEGYFKSVECFSPREVFFFAEWCVCGHRVYFVSGGVAAKLLCKNVYYTPQVVCLKNRLCIFAEVVMFTLWSYFS